MSASTFAYVNRPKSGGLKPPSPSPCSVPAKGSWYRELCQEIVFYACVCPYAYVLVKIRLNTSCSRCLNYLPFPITFAGVYQPNRARMAMDLHYYNGDCTSPEAQEQIKQNFIEILVGSNFKEICLDDVFKDKCKADNVRVKCDLVPAITTRKKRSIGRSPMMQIRNPPFRFSITKKLKHMVT